MMENVEQEISTILIVDDKTGNILALQSLLEQPDRRFLQATSGTEALKSALSHDIDLIILDVQMPDMDGFEVAEILRSNKRTKNIPIIFASAEKKGHNAVLKGFEEGAIDYLFKPLNSEVTKAKVSVLLKIQLQQRELLKKNSSLERSALLINNSADIIGIIDATTLKIESLNQAFNTILGYTLKEVEETSLLLYLQNEDRNRVQTLAKSTKDRL